jgi:lipoprotein signal peptidase
MLYWRMRDSGGLGIKATFGLILGGAIGNLIDRFAHAYVVDFIHFQIRGIFDFAVFNVADSAITLGVIGLAYLLWRGFPQDDETHSRSEPQAIGDPVPAPARATPAPRVRNPRPRSR